MSESNEKLRTKDVVGVRLNEFNCRAGLNLMEQILYMFEHALYTDCTFHLGDKQIGAHRLILGLASPVFEAMFLRHHEMTEAVSGVVNITDISYNTFNTVLKYIYSEKLELKGREDAVEVLLAADKYQLDSLRLLCLDKIKSSVTADNVWQALTLVTTLDQKPLIDTFTQVLRDHTLSCTGSESFMECSEDNVVLLVSQDTLSLDGEHALVLLVERWARNQAQQRGQAGSDQDVGEILRPRILPLLRLLSLTPAQFTSSVKFAGWLSKNDKEVIVAKNVTNFPDYLCKDTKSRNWQNELSWDFNVDTDFPPKFQNVTVCRPVNSDKASNHKLTRASSCGVYFRVSDTILLNGVILRTQVHPKDIMQHVLEPCPFYNDHVSIRLCSVSQNYNASSYHTIAETSFIGPIRYDSTINMKFDSPAFLEVKKLHYISVTMLNSGLYKYNSDTVSEFMYKHVTFNFQSYGLSMTYDVPSSNEVILQSLIISTNDSAAQEIISN